MKSLLIFPLASAATNANTNTKTTNSNTKANTNGGGSSTGSIVVPPKIKNPVGEESLLAVGTKFINFMLAMIVIAAVVTIVIAGFRMVLGGGNESQVTKSKKAILYAIGGLAVAFLSFAIVQIIQNVLS